MNYLKEHWELLSSFAFTFFAFGGIYSKHKEQGKKIERLELIIEKEIPEIKAMLARIDERTKNL